MSDPARLARRAIARATDLHANNALPEVVEQGFAVGGVVAEIGNDPTITMIGFQSPPARSPAGCRTAQRVAPQKR